MKPTTRKQNTNNRGNARATSTQHATTKNHREQEKQHTVLTPRSASGRAKAASEATQLERLLRIGSSATLFHTQSGEPFACMPVDGHTEVAPMHERGNGFRTWLVHCYYRETGSAPNPSALTCALGTLRSRAQYDGPVAGVHVRIAPGDDGALYLDLGNAQWEVVKITRDGWDVVREYPVYFRRPPGLLPLPIPEAGGSVTALRQYVNVASEDDWKLVVGWLLGVFHPSGPYPILNLAGQQGSAKSSTARRLRAVIDPNQAPLRNAPRNVEDLVIAAKNGRILTLDNLSDMPVWLSDALCRMATDSGYATRALYTNDEESIFQARRPIIMNGIEELTARGDLASRCMTVSLPTIDRAHRKTEEELERAWAEDHPQILGALLDAVVTILAKKDHVRLAAYPRMADFVKWISAAETALGWEPGAFLAAFEQNQTDAVVIQLDSSLVAQALLQFTDQHPRGMVRRISSSRSLMIKSMIK